MLNFLRDRRALNEITIRQLEYSVSFFNLSLLAPDLTDSIPYQCAKEG